MKLTLAQCHNNKLYSHFISGLQVYTIIIVTLRELYTTMSTSLISHRLHFHHCHLIQMDWFGSVPLSGRCELCDLLGFTRVICLYDDGSLLCPNCRYFSCFLLTPGIIE